MNLNYLLIAVVLLGLAGCAQNPGRTPVTGTEPAGESDDLIDRLQEAVEGGQFRNAEPLLQQLSQHSLSEEDQLRLDLLLLELFLAEGNVARADEILQNINRDQLNRSDTELQIRYGLLKAEYYELTGNFLSAARERDFLSGILDGEEKERNHEMIWQDLVNLPMEALLKWAESAAQTQFAGWLTLAAIARNPAYTLEEHVAAVKNWQQTNPGHPAAITLPGGLSLLEQIADQQPSHIALLLPLSGNLGKSGQAVRDGFMAAYYQTLSKGYEVPTISVIDTHAAGSLELAYGDAVALGAEWVVGPLDKKRVNQLASGGPLPLPTLALNYSDQLPLKEGPEDLFQFGLAAEDDARLIAEQAYLQGHRRVLALLPDSAWGQRIYDAFRERWDELGGEIAEERFYKQQKDFNPEIKALLNVDNSQARVKAIRGIMRERIEFEPRRRQDVDWVFLIALPKQGRQIRPMFDFNFAGDLPVYSTSHIYEGKTNRKKDDDLNGIRFTDLPWLLEASELKTQVEKEQKQARGRLARLYAMGVDAFRLYPRLQQLAAFPHSRIFGVTGDLSMDMEGKVHRRTRFAIFRSGRPVLTEMAEESPSAK